MLYFKIRFLLLLVSKLTDIKYINDFFVYLRLITAHSFMVMVIPETHVMLTEVITDIL